MFATAPPNLASPSKVASLSLILLNSGLSLPITLASYKLVVASSSIGGAAMERAVILGAARTPFGKFGGALPPLSAPELGGAAIREAIGRSGVEDGESEHSR
jgi:hypothetical protein